MKKYLLSVVLAAILSVATVSMTGAQGGRNIHYVAFGETLSSISMKYGVSSQAIMAHNGIANPNMIYVGQPLIIPGVQNNSPGQSSGGAYACASYHVVAVGETLSDIAYRNGLTLQTLMQQNNLYNGDLVYVGQKICLPVAPGYKPQPASYRQNYSPPANAHYHVVAGGESLHVIAVNYNVNYMEIMQANNLVSPDFIWVGQRLIIPGYNPVPLPAPLPAPLPEKPPVPAPAPGQGYEEVRYEHHSYREYHSSGDTPVAVPYAVPPHAPMYGGGSPGESGPSAGAPAAPEHQPVPVQPILPEADHPIEVVVNGGVNWVGTSDTIPDPTGITTLIVKTGEEYGQVVHVRSGDYHVKGESDDIFLGEFGAFRFVFRHIPAGDFDVWIEDPERESEVVRVHVSPGDRAEILFEEGVSQSGPTYASPDGWVLSSWDNPSKPKQNIGGWSNIMVTAPAPGLWIMIESEGGGYKAKCLTGSKGPGSCDFAGLSAGLYWFWIDGTGLKVKTYMDGAAYATFEFARQPSPSNDPNAVGPVDYTDYKK